MEFENAVVGGEFICPYCGADGIEEVDFESNIFVFGEYDDAGWAKSHFVCPSCEEEWDIEVGLSIRDRKVLGN